MEGIALTGAWTDKDKGLPSMIILEMGGSSRLCRCSSRVSRRGDGTDGKRRPRFRETKQCSWPAGVSAMRSCSHARAIKDNGCRVVYFAATRRTSDVFKRDEIEAEQIRWSGGGRRGSDRAETPAGPVVRRNNRQAMLWYAEQRVIPSRAVGEGSPSQYEGDPSRTRSG